MRGIFALSLSTLPSLVLGDGFVARRKGGELNFRAVHADDAPDQTVRLEKRVSCGKGTGSCPSGQCCSESGNCGTTKAYCTSPSCQIAYSNGNCDSSKRPDGETTANVPRQTTGKVPYNVYITNCSQPGTVALTFGETPIPLDQTRTDRGANGFPDDGPYTYTDHILDVLEENNVKATFFIVGNNLGKGRIDDASTGWPKVLRRMHSAGHQLASHSWSHEDLSAASDEIRQQQIIYNEMAFRNIFGWFPKYLRPPYGSCSRVSGCLDYVTKLGYHVVNWNLDTKDYEHDSPSEIQTSKSTFSEGVSTAANSHSYIELSHDVHQQTAYNLTSFMIKTIKERGYRAVTVGECLGDSPQNWYVDASGTKTSPTAASFCGSTSGYCDGGCQAGFGKCNTWKASDGLIVSDNGLCGDKYKQTCKGSRYGSCCSKYGNCGKTDAYCGSGCQNGYGICS
ncbi:hypothetical protein FZEAL_1762 [Fusarium zealandicum]|uniref:Chitin binding protein n=1 Tax=Fusarium zealandicum TaxID=1053134 RepID=A0A8H4US45_9HYPO|nr:hypothetical protein FZEAL_1762 [Fusarium zealandicum]